MACVFHRSGWVDSTRDVFVFFVNGSLLLMSIFSSCYDTVVYEDIWHIWFDDVNKVSWLLTPPQRKLRCEPKHILACFFLRKISERLNHYRMAYQHLPIILLLHACDLNMDGRPNADVFVRTVFHGLPGASNKTQKMDEHGGQFPVCFVVFLKFSRLIKHSLDEKWWQIAQKLRTCIAGIAMSPLLRFCSCSPLIFFFSFVLLTLSQATYTYLVAWQDVQRWWCLSCLFLEGFSFL